MGSCSLPQGLACLEEGEGEEGEGEGKGRLDSGEGQDLYMCYQGHLARGFFCLHDSLGRKNERHCGVVL